MTAYRYRRERRSMGMDRGRPGRFSYDNEKTPPSRIVDDPAEAVPPRLLRVREVMQMTAVSRATIHRLERAGDFPRRRRLAGHSVAWLEGEVREWVATRPTVPPFRRTQRA